VTTFENKCLILSDLWLNYRQDAELEEMFSYFDLAFPLAFAEVEGAAKISSLGKTLIDECWEELLRALDKEDTGFESLADMQD
jgi:hypothetical protein